MLSSKGRGKCSSCLRAPDLTGHHHFEMGRSRALHQGKLVLCISNGCYDSEQIQEILSLFLGNILPGKLCYLPSFPNAAYTNTRACAVVSGRCLPSALLNSQSHARTRVWCSWGQSKFLVGGVLCCNHSFLSVFKLNSSKLTVGGTRGFCKSRQRSFAAAKLPVNPRLRSCSGGTG